MKFELTNWGFFLDIGGVEFGVEMLKLYDLLPDGRQFSAN